MRNWEEKTILWRGGLVQSMALAFHSSVAKGLKLIIISTRIKTMSWDLSTYNVGQGIWDKL